MKTYKHLVFDIDGTLADTEEIHVVSLQQTLRELKGKEMSAEELAFTLGMPGIKTMEALGFEEPGKAFESWDERYMECSKKMGVKLFPGVKEVLDQLEKEDVTMGILTSKAQNEYEFSFLDYGYGRYFSCAVLAGETPNGKPHPDPMLEYMRRTGAKPEEVLYIGDTLYDMQCANAAGTDGALALWGCANPAKVDNATYRLEKMEDVLKFVQK